ncbi:MAG: succinate dehydrogenase iron-sulfur subunit [Candidatus Binatia bacterium]
MSQRVDTIEVKVRRQDGPESEPYWEEFSIPYKAQHNVISVLMEIQAAPVTRQGERTRPVVWESNCLEEVCGACTMVINGRVRQACSTLIDNLEQPVTLEPMAKFPLVRDLVVDRSRMFENLKRVKAWVAIDGTYDLGAGPRQSQDSQAEAYAFSRCMTCGCCLEACPQYSDSFDFIGANTLGQVYMFNTHPTAAMTADERLSTIMGRGGLSDCGNAQNCVEVCPKEIPLTKAIAKLGRDVTLKSLRDLLLR